MLTKQQSKILQGIAILLMMFHHFFAYNDGEFSFLLPDFSLHLAWFGKICVGIFAFVSGYGIYYVLNKIRQKENQIIGTQYLEMLKRMLRLLLKYWLVIFIHVIVSIFICKEAIGLVEIIKNSLLIDFSFNGSWWFVRQYAMMLCIAPVIDLLFATFSKKGKRVAGIMLVLAAIVLFIILDIKFIAVAKLLDFIRPSFMMIFIMGYVFSYFNIFAFFEKLLKDNLLVQIILGLFLVVAVFVLRTLLTDTPSYARGDFVFVPFFAFGALLLTKHLKWLQLFLEQLGASSTFMWLIHINIFGRTSEALLKFTNNGMIIYIIEVILSFVFSWGLIKIGGVLRKK